MNPDANQAAAIAEIFRDTLGPLLNSSILAGQSQAYALLAPRFDAITPSDYADICHSLIWDDIEQDERQKELRKLGVTLVAISRNRKEIYLAYKDVLILRLSKASKRGRITVTRWSKNATKFDRQLQLPFLFSEPLHAYLYYILDDNGITIRETGIMIPPGEGIERIRLPFAKYSANELLFTMEEGSNQINTLKKQLEKRKRKLKLKPSAQNS